MLKLDELDKLQQRNYQAGLSALLKEKPWDLDARKCLEVKIVEWEINSSKQSDFQSNLVRCNNSEGIGKVTPESKSDDESMETDEEEESEMEEETEEHEVEGVEEDIDNNEDDDDDKGEDKEEEEQDRNEDIEEEEKKREKMKRNEVNQKKMSQPTY